MSKLATVIILASLTISISQIQTVAAAEDFGSLDGTWQGTLKVVATSNEEASKELNKLPYKIVIEGNKAHVFFRDQEVKPNTFKVEQVLTNAAVFAINSGKDNDGTWVESWVFSTTQKNHDSLIVNFSWMVNNNHLVPENKIARMSAVAIGEFQRQAK